MDKACKSNGSDVLAIRRQNSGERVRNTWLTYLEVGDNLAKAWLIPHVIARSKLGIRKDLALQDGAAAYQVVGGVMAHQADDG